MKYLQDGCVAFDYNFPIYNWFFPSGYKKMDKDIEEKLAEDRFNIFSIAGSNPQFRALYVHIPFCQDICSFCHFSREVCLDESVYEQYADALVKEIEKKGQYDNITKHPIQAIFFGGGTPSILKPKQILKIGKAIHDTFDLSQLKEFSYEMNAKTVTPDRIEALKKIGVTHARMGVQTFNPKYRKLFKLTATLEQIYEGVKLLNNNFKYVCIDMLYGMHGQSMDEFAKDLHHAINLGTPTIDVYPINNMVTQLGLSDSYRKARLAPTSGLGKFSMNVFLNEYMRNNGFLPHNGHGYVRVSEEELERRPVVTDRYRFQYHEGVYGYKGHEIIGLGSGAFSSFDGFSVGNNNKPKEYIKNWLEKGTMDIVIGQYDEKLTDIKGLVLHLPYYGEVEKERIDMTLIPDEVQRNLEAAIQKGLITESETKYQLTQRGWYWYVNLLYQLLPQKEQDLLLRYVEKQTAQEERFTENWKIALQF